MMEKRQRSSKKLTQSAIYRRRRNGISTVRDGSWKRRRGRILINTSKPSVVAEGGRGERKEDSPYGSSENPEEGKEGLMAYEQAMDQLQVDDEADAQEGRGEPHPVALPRPNAIHRKIKIVSRR